jgi:biopolymer transport protein ExbD
MRGKWVELVIGMLSKSGRSLKLISGMDASAFASILIVLVFIVMIFDWTSHTSHHGFGVDIPYASHSVAMPGALREDAMLVTVTRDGRIWFGRDQVAFGDLAGKIQDRLKDRGVERKVYVKVDMRARYGAVKEVLDSVLAAGILRVAFMVNQHRLSAITHSS